MPIYFADDPSAELGPALRSISASPTLPTRVTLRDILRLLGSVHPIVTGMGAADAIKELYDGAITSHGFDPFMRDYWIEVARWTDSDDGAPYTYRFTHCVLVEVTSLLPAQTWMESWATPTDLAAWERSGSGGFAWGVGWANIEDAALTPGSERAREWASQVGHDMHEVVIDTNVYRLTIIFHELVVSSPSSPVVE